MNFNPVAFLENLSYTGEGMLAIFVVISVIILITAVINNSLEARHCLRLPLRLRRPTPFGNGSPAFTRNS